MVAFAELAVNSGRRTASDLKKNGKHTIVDSTHYTLDLNNQKTSITQVIFMNMQEALHQALDFEEKGFDIYTNAAENTNNPMVRKTFNYLADQEQLHIDEIKKYIERNEVEIKGDSAKDTKKFFNMTVSQFRKKTELSDDDIEAYEAGLKLEQDSYDFYKKQLAKADSDKMKKFFEFLMEQERAHYQLIEKAYMFIKNPEGFFAEEEDWFFEG